MDDLLFEHFRQNFEIATRLEQTISSEHFPSDRAERKHIAATIELFATRLFGAHVTALALDRADARLRRSRCRLGNAKVHQFYRVIVAHHDVMRRTVAMHDVERRAVGIGTRMGIIERFRRFTYDPRDLRIREALLVLLASIAQNAKIGAIDELHRYIPVVIDLADFVNVDDIRMLETKRYIALVFEHRHETFVFGIGRQYAFERYIDLRHRRIGITRLVDFCHAAYGYLTV